MDEGVEERGAVSDADVRAAEAGAVKDEVDDFVEDLRFSVDAGAEDVVIDAPPDGGDRWNE